MIVEEQNVKKKMLKKGASWKFTLNFRAFRVCKEIGRVVGKSNN
jgi:hypothetical protein